LFLSPAVKDETSFKLCRIEDKTTVNGGVQINLHDGSNILVKVADPKDPKEDIYGTFDVLKLSIPDKEVIGCVELKEGNFAVITGGKNIGVQGKIVEIEKAEAKKRRNSLVVIEDAKGTRYQTILDFVFSIGEAQSLITTPEAANVV
jgi:small subunit ribosomal protein S4e